MQQFHRVLLSVVASSFFTMSAQASDVEGAASATFINPIPGSAVVSGVGTNSFNWGDAASFGTGPNNMTFNGVNFASAFETPFKLGTLTYYNGTTALGTTADTVDLSVNLGFVTPSIPNVTANFGLSLISTPNTADATESADYVKFNNPFSNTTFDIGGVTYHVRINGFSNVVGDGFLVSDATQFHVLEGNRATADLYGSVTTVPEPESYALMVAGLALVSAFVRRSKVSI